MHNIHEAAYKLTADPFRMSPDHRFSYNHRSYARAKGYLDYALIQGEGFIMITGEPGTGKTTLINEILAGIDRAQLQVATLTSTQVQTRDLLQMVATSFELRFADAGKATLLTVLEQFLRQLHRDRRRAVLIVDEAQGLSTSALEELRLLANLQHQDQMLLQVFLVGQQQLRGLVNEPHMEQLRQRIIASSHLEPLNLDDTVSYVEHRLLQAGWEGDPGFSGDALQLVHTYSGGIPRRINLICTRLLLAGAMSDKHAFTGQDARDVILELQQEMLIDADESDSQEATAGPEVNVASLPRPAAEKPSSDTLLEGEPSPGHTDAVSAESTIEHPHQVASAEQAAVAVREEPATPEPIRQRESPDAPVHDDDAGKKSEEPGQVSSLPDESVQATMQDATGVQPGEEMTASADPDARSTANDSGLSDRTRTRVKISRAVTRRSGSPWSRKPGGSKLAVRPRAVSPDDFVAGLPVPEVHSPDAGIKKRSTAPWGILLAGVVLVAAVGMIFQNRVISISVQSDRQGIIHRIKTVLMNPVEDVKKAGDAAILQYR